MTYGEHLMDESFEWSKPLLQLSRTLQGMMDNEVHFYIRLWNDIISSFQVTCSESRRQ